MVINMAKYVYISKDNTEALMHYGVLGMKWGVRKDKKSGYRSTSIRSAIARRQNEKVDKSFKKWQEGAKNRENAIELGKEANRAKMASSKDPKNKNLKKAYKDANRNYKKALKKNTSYRKGTVRQEVGKDLSRKYLSEAKSIQKKLNKDPDNKSLQKQYQKAMNRHDVERAKARRAQSVGAARSSFKAGLKRSITIAAKGAVIAGGVAVASNYLDKHSDVRFGSPEMMSAAKRGLDFVKKYSRYMY